MTDTRRVGDRPRVQNSAYSSTASIARFFFISLSWERVCSAPILLPSRRDHLSYPHYPHSMPNVLRHIEAQALAAWRFVTLDMWRLTRASLAAPTRLGVATLRVLYMTVQA